ncbi:deoxyuridine 5'-triphosphate nucleotidohydrolase [Myxococcus phage Mx1]|nr:deoxyuridine 5'-triphosphate nucleotidohydrolase [Myxococcus phage Mx1]
MDIEKLVKHYQELEELKRPRIKVKRLRSGGKRGDFVLGGGLRSEISRALGDVAAAPESEGALPLPKYETELAAGMDARADFGFLEGEEQDPWPQWVSIGPGEYRAIGTGLAFSIPPGYEIQIRSRSGLALKYGVTVLNAPGTIDADYRGELKVILVNHGPSPFAVRHGDRIAQLVVAPVVQAVLEEAEDLDGTERGTNGFGSTGTT